MRAVQYQTMTVDGLEVFYREAGDPQRPTLVLLHGFPSSSHMFRDLIPLLADDFHLIAPDLLGFGYSAAPSVKQFSYTFDSLAEVTAKLLRQIHVESYSMYVQDYGAPIGWRLALTDPGVIETIVSQNGNAYEAGFFDSAWTRRAMAYGADPSAEHEEDVRGAFTLDDVRWQYLTGTPNPTLLSPDAWHHAVDRLARPGVDQIQLALFRDYRNNVPLYPQVHTYLRESAVPTLVVWGEGDQIFGPDGARAFAADAIEPEIHLLPGGHFLLESAAPEVAALIRDFLNRRLITVHP
ncbi:alpha/beta fold hydrolase [Glaciibacter flavus]|uniref:alpha/beta fold hydrolase n=1 Tax=Orlajensenia flava TaxID=2565934 RepID=UPI003B00434D